MTKLNPETAQQIASLITSTRVNNIMARDDAENAAYWMACEYRNMIELAEEFGIVLPSYGLAKENLEKPHFRDAVLTADKI
jgi:adenosine deaminase